MTQQIKYCQYCGKPLLTQQNRNTYCSTQCAQAAKVDKKIELWLNGDFNGLCKDGTLSQTIRNYLLRQANYQCSVCGWNQVNPITKKVPLEIHHIDGDYQNNTLENLQVLCPNCHSLTANYKALNRNSDRQRTQVRKENHCVDCGAIINYGSTRCKQCNAKTQITKKPYTREELKDLIRTQSFTTIGAAVGVSDNTIRKWCARYGLPTKKKDIKQYTDTEWELI